MKHTSARWQHNTPQIEPSKSEVMVIHPHHYLFGQKVEIIRNLPNSDSDDVVILLPDKTYTVISLQLTDYYSSDGKGLTANSNLLDITCLSEVVKLIDCIQNRQSTPRNKDITNNVEHDPS